MTETMTIAEFNATRRGGKRAKFGNVVTWADGMRFDSKREADRWMALKMLARAGVIRDLQRQVPFLLQVEGHPICKLVIDFYYIEDGHRVGEDAKGFQTPESKLKMRLAKACFPDIEWRLS